MARGSPEENEEEEEEDFLDGDEEEFDDEEDEDLEDRSDRKRRRGSQFIDDVAEEDDEEDEEEDEGPRKKKGGGYRRSAFIDDVAAVASDDEEEEEGEEEGFIDEGAELGEDEEGVGGQRPPVAHHRTLLPRDDEVDDEDYAKFIEERYARANEASAAFEEGEATEVEQQALLPSVKDPKLWLVKCTQGHEREAVVSLMQKAVNYEAEGRPLLIKSAIALDSLSSMVYVEAEKEAHVKEACKGLRLLQAYKISLVPITEMAAVMTVQQHGSVEVDVGAWVRVKAGLYKGDLAQVVDVDSLKQTATIKLLPRIDLQSLAQKLNGQPTTKKKSRPPARFFSVEEAENNHLRPQETRHRGTGELVYTIEGHHFMNGYLLKPNLKLRSLDSHNVVPTLDELQRFQKPGNEGMGGGGGGEGENGRGMLAPSLANQQRARLVKGDLVMVVEGDLKGILGSVEKSEEEEVLVRLQHKEIKELVPLKPQQLRKFFRAGDHVKVIAGQHAGVTGMVVKVEVQAVVLLSDSTHEHVKVFSRDIVSSAEVTAGPLQLGEYELHDLVLLDQSEFGMIVRVEPHGCHVLRAVPDHADVAPIKLLEIRRKIFDRNSNQADGDGNSVGLNDVLRVVEGPYRGKQGTVEHLHRGILFLHDRTHTENGGYFCVRARSCRLMGGRGGGGGGMGGDLQRRALGSPLSDAYSLLRSPGNFSGPSPRRGPTPSPSHGGRGGFSGSAMTGMRGRGGRGGRGDPMIGRTVKIRSGPFKGYRGRVLDATDSSARVELESQMKVVTVRRNQLPDGEVIRAQPATPFRDAARYGSGSETPMHPSRTPLRDPTATPMHEGMRTPMRDRAWNPSIPNTPMRSSTGWDDNNPASWGPGAAFSGPPFSSSTPNNPPSGSTPSSGYTPYTPAASSAYSPAGSEHLSSRNPSTPGLHSYDPSPLSGVPSFASPSPYSVHSGTPSVLPLTPGSGSGMAPSPYTPGTPGGLPLTPGGVSLDPTTPGAGLGDVTDGKWGLPGVAVKVKQSASGDDAVGVIRDVLPDGSCRVALGATGDGEVTHSSLEDMELVAPRKNDKVKIIHGDLRGLVGKLIGTDGGEGIVKMDDDLDVKILDIMSLGKVA